MPTPRPARRALLLVAGLALLAGPARAAPCPLTPADLDLVDVQALISELALHAKTCGTEARYNGFVARYKPQLAAQAAGVDAYFARVGGARAQAEHDVFITNLANAQSTAAETMGTDFCPRDAPMFDEVMALDDGGELAAYAAGKNLVPASALPDCTVAAPARPRSRAVRRRRR